MNHEHIGPEQMSSALHKVSFNWRDYQPAALRKIGTDRDYAPRQHLDMQEECEAIMDRIAAVIPPDFRPEGDPMLAYIEYGKEKGVVTDEEVEMVIGLYGPLGSGSVH